MTSYHNGRVTDSFDACVTDPPYHLVSGNLATDWSSFKTEKGTTNKSGRGHRRTGFMGKSWEAQETYGNNHQAFHAGPQYGDSGSAARFFATFPQDAKRFHYTSKADGDDRLGSKHPTVKPLGLIQWLCRLITPPKGHILDCFAGTGTTAEAALREGFCCTLIEREAEYIADIDRRMALVLEGSTGRSVAMAKLKPEGEPLPLFAEAAE